MAYHWVRRRALAANPGSLPVRFNVKQVFVCVFVCGVYIYAQKVQVDQKTTIMRRFKSDS